MAEDFLDAAEVTVEQPIYKLRGYLGILSERMKPEVRANLKKRLHIVSPGWRDEPPTHVDAHYSSDGYFWVPRFFYENAIRDGCLGRHPINYQWAEGQPVDLPNHITLDPRRGQPAAVDAMERWLRAHSGGMLEAPTGMGKTITAYSIAHRFKTSIGVLVYNEHMLKNWIETAKTVFGLDAKDVGIVQRDECGLGKPVTVMMVQSLLANDYPEELYRQIGFIIADEVHRYGAPQWNEVMRLFPARYRLGMTAEAKRPDNLGKLFFWHFGSIGHRAEMQTPKPAVTMLFYKKHYPAPTYCDWDGRLNDGEGGWIPNPVRFHKLLSNDKGRNMLIVEELCLARAAGRRILIFSHFKKHLATLTKMFERAWTKRKGAPTKITLLVGGLKGAKLDDAMSGEMIFTTYSFSREALNLPHIDTLLCGTPAGNPLQPIGRLRDKGPEDRKPLLAIDIYEGVPYSKRRARARRNVYVRLKLKLAHAIRERRIPAVRKKKKEQS